MIPPPSDAGAAFGPFRLHPPQRLLAEDGRPVKLGSRAFDILALLVARAGATVSKQELLAHVWPDTVVEETNLRVHVAALRKALGDGPQRRYIDSVAGGYVFVAPVTHEAPRAGGPDTARAGLAHAIALQLAACRFVTVTGTAGVGKSTLAHGVVRQVDEQYAVRWVELADAIDVPGALATALGLPPGTDPVPPLQAAVRGRPTLVVFDNCERHAAGAAGLAERLLRDVPGLCVLATSREALRAAGEHVQRVEPLAAPPANAATAGAALAWPAVALFAERAAALHAYALTDADAPAVAELCRRLDGVPLALSLAAARLDLFPPRELVARLDDRLHILNGGLRTAHPRHRSLRASLEWSEPALPAVERRVLHSVALFDGAFGLAQAVQVASSGNLAADDVEEALASLDDKSLLVTLPGAGATRCRLYANVRTYALACLAPDDAAHGRFAAWCAAAVAQPDADASLLADAGTALAWAFGPHGATASGTALLAASVPLWMEAGRLDELHAWLEGALLRVTETGGAPADEMALCAALGTVRVYQAAFGTARGPFARAFALAERLGDVERLADAYSGLALEDVLAGDYGAAVALSHRFAHAIRDAASRSAQLVHDRVAALALHLAGDAAQAATLARAVQNQTVPAACTRRRTILHTDENVAAGCVLARSRWLLGHPDDALRLARNGVLRARAVGGGAPLCYALAFAMFPVAMWCGDRNAAHDALRELEAACAGMPIWSRLAVHHRHVLEGMVTPDVVASAPALGPHRETLATLDAGYADAALLHRANHGQARWCAAELSRIEGERLLAAGEADGAEAHLRRALLLARHQGAVAWELRAALGLARLWHRRGVAAQAYELLARAVEPFTEGFGTADLAMAQRLLAQWGRGVKNSGADARPRMSNNFAGSTAV